MECGVCGMRSSVGYCVVCQKMLCEECGIRCEKCGKMVCSEHMYETSSGKQLCIECQKERKREHARRRQEAAAGAAPEAVEEAPEEEEDATAEVLTASAQRRIEPWAWSLFIAIGGAALVLLLLVFPTLRRAPVTTSFFIPVSLVPMIIAVFAIVWGIVGLVREEHYEDRPKCFAGLGLAALTILLAVVAIWTDPARGIETETQMLQSDREGMTEEELEQWRQQRLEKFEQ